MASVSYLTHSIPMKLIIHPNNEAKESVTHRQDANYKKSDLFQVTPVNVQTKTSA